MVRSFSYLCALAATLILTYSSHAEEKPSEIPAAVTDILAKRCLECHDELSEKGGVNLDHVDIDWSTDKTTSMWEKTYNVVAHQQMPPVDEPQLTPKEKHIVLTYLDKELTENTPIGGTLPRRLNRLEYQNCIQTVFRMYDYQLPLGFPKDTRSHGFDTVSESLVLSPPLLDSYRVVARQIADELYPPKKEKPPVKKLTAGVDDLVLSFSASTIHGDALRLASRSNSIMRSCTWPSKIETPASGTYKITVKTSAFRPDPDKPMMLEVRARALSASDRSAIGTFRVLKEIEVTNTTPQTVTFDANLYAGETPLLRWANADLDHTPKVFRPLLEKQFKKDKRFHAAWVEMLFPSKPDKPRGRASVTSLRGRNGWDIFQRHYKNSDLSMEEANFESRYTKLALGMADNAGVVRALGDTFSYHYHENGPALQIHQISVEGPFELIEDPKDKERRSWREWSFSTRKEGETDEQFVKRGLQTFLPRLFRRPVEAEVQKAYLEIAKKHWAEGNTFEEGMHLLLRNALVSPRFLYRETNSGELDQHDLASRLAFFLTRHPPTSDLVHHARAGRLSDPALFRSEAERLMPKSPSSPMIRDFTEQWLHTRLLPEIMPDEKFDFTTEETDIAKAEAEHFFFTLLDENRPLSDFIDPDFLTTSKRFAQEHYGYPVDKEKKIKHSAPWESAHKKIEHLPIERGGKRGGLLGQTAILMATANGVDTQPVLRGVWVLENILGTPLPPVPSNVPALTPDIRGATTPRELLEAHTKDADCRGCHQQIDPIGFVLENFDPVGRWRDNWPEAEAPIDPSGTLPDGTEILDYTDFKKWLAGNTGTFAECLGEKLMIYATGRIPSYAERKEISQIVANIQKTNGGFQDFLLALIESKTFRTR
ncbi:MAG: hypothetical protein CMO55_06710 [Verrucomicrobiales bacterium]|nr:hypothetical protein [Verrucomicrobiales bacterium]